MDQFPLSDGLGYLPGKLISIDVTKRPFRNTESHGFKGRFREVTPPERVVRTFEWDGMPGHVIIETGILDDLGDGRTKFVNVSLFRTTEERDGMLQSGMEGGLDESYEALDRLLAKLA